MIFHGGQEGDLDSEPPEEERGVNLELLGHVAPFLRIVGEDAR